MKTHTVREEITEIVNKLFVYTDYQKWQELQAEVFSGVVDFDMSSLGGEVKKLKSAEICQMWKDGFAGLDAVNHLAGNYIIEVRESDAFVFAYSTATHYKASATQGKTREFVGSYEIKLAIEASGWRINGFKYNLKFATGNLDLV